MTDAECLDYGLDEEGQIPDQSWSGVYNAEDTVVVPEGEDLGDAIDILEASIDPLSESENWGIDIYYSARELLIEYLSNDFG